MLESGRARRTARLAAHLRGLPAEDLSVLARAAELLDGVVREA